MPVKIFKRTVCFCLTLTLLAGCFPYLKSAGGGQTEYAPPRELNAADVALPEGYQIEVVAQGLSFPTGVTFDDKGRVYVVEAGYSYGEVFTTPRLVRIGAAGQLEVVATGSNPPWNGVTFYEDAFYVAGGTLGEGQVSRITPQGEITTLVGGLPSLGDHHTNGPVVGPDGLLYFGQGTATNSGVVGADNADFGWLARQPGFHDVPCEDVKLLGRNFTTRNPLTDDPQDLATTGAYVPFGTRTTAGQVIAGRLPCGGSVMRIPLQGGEPELVAWGFRNPFGLAWSPEGQLYVVENSYDVRGSRPVFGSGDVLWQVEPGTWYGWPDFHGARPLTEEDQYRPPKEAAPGFVLEHQAEPPRPAALLGVHSSSNGLDFSRADAFGHVGEAFIAQFGDMAPGVGKVLSPVGFKVVRVEVGSGVIQDFAVNRDPSGPASKTGLAGLERPIAVRFSPDATALYVVDFGVMTTGERIAPQKGTGVLWRITREER